MLITAVLLFAFGYVANAQTKSQTSVVSTLSNTSEEQLDEAVNALIKKHGQTPIIEGKKAIFLAKSVGGKAPLMLADFNGFMNPRYVKDKQLAAMHRIGNSAWFYLEKEFEPDAIVNYRLAFGKRIQTDPNNPNQRLNFGDTCSYLAMPAFQPDQYSEHKTVKSTGKVIKHNLKSEIMGQDRTIHVYLPHGYEQMEGGLPSIYFHDGSYYVNEAKIPELLDQLIDEEKMAPVIAVFDDPVVRGKEYQGDLDYRNYIQQELIPHIDSQFNTVRGNESRAVVGGSRGGMSALYLAHGTDAFGLCAAFSPAIHPVEVDHYIDQLKLLGKRPKEVVLTGSTYDHVWYEDAVALKSYFESSDIKSSYIEVHAGHNIPAWRSALDDILIRFFPSE